MRSNHTTLFPLVAIGLSLYSSALAAQEAGSPPHRHMPEAQDQVRDRPGFGGMPRPPREGEPGDKRMMEPPRSSPAFELAQDLSAAETMIGIKSNQLDVWRNYSSALIAMVARPMRQDMVLPVNGEPDKGRPLAEVLIDRAIADGIAAKNAKAALDALKMILTPEQQQLLELAERNILREPSFHPPMHEDANSRPPGDHPTP
jgi:hypothetical protein